MVGYRRVAGRKEEKGAAGGVETGEVKAEQLSMVNDLQLIGACGNALHVATAWKNSLLWTAW